MSTLETLPSDKQASTVSLREAGEAKEQLWNDARRLLAEGNPWAALPKKAEAIGLKPLEGFYSMAAQKFSERLDLWDQGHPLSDGRMSRQFEIKATAELFPSADGGESLLADIRRAAEQEEGSGTQVSKEQASKALHEIDIRRRELQYQRAFDEVGMFTENSGFIAARGGNGDLLVAPDTPVSRQTLEEAGYRDGREFGITLGVPFNNDPASRQGVQWVTGTGVEPMNKL